MMSYLEIRFESGGPIQPATLAADWLWRIDALEQLLSDSSWTAAQSALNLQFAIVGCSGMISAGFEVHFLHKEVCD